MNVLFLIGNGFDKAQGLNTSYQEFYNFLKDQKAESKLEERLKSEIQSDYETWADLEEGLGKYSEQFTDANTFLEVLDIINRRLNGYLLKENERLKTIAFSRSRLVRYLCYPELELESKQKELYNNLLASHKGDIYVDCVSFNYTSTIEHVMEGQTSLFLNRTANNNNVYLRRVVHLHGTLDDMILLGVNDVSQIKNTQFRNDTNIIENFVKPEINNGCENMRNEMVMSLIEHAHLIVLFGVSVGLTDLQWWKAIGTCLDNSSVRLIYYPYNTDMDVVAHPNYKLRWAKEYINFLKERMGSARSVEELRERVYVGINKPFLDIVENNVKKGSQHPLDKLV